MPATPIAASDRYFARGKSKIYSLTTVVSLAAPTRAELNAGTDLSPEVAGVSGWLVEATDIETPDLATSFTGKIPGSTSIGEASIDMYADDNGADVRTLLPRGTTAFIYLMYGGDVTGAKMDGFKCRVKSVGKPVTLGDDASIVTVSFTILTIPSENISVPA